MPYNPCGRVVDYARRPYRTKARFFRDSDVEVDIQWYQAAADAPSLPFPCSIMSLDWLDDLYDEPWAAEVGEVWNEPRPYSFKPPPIGLDYSHICGTAEDFAEGATFDPSREVQYDEQGLPLCCEGPRTPPMGLVLGLEVGVTTDTTGGATCDEAPLVVVGQVMYTPNDNPGFPLVWWRVLATTGQTITFKSLEGAPPPNDAFETLSGTTCSDPLFFTTNAFINPTTRTATVTSVGTTVVYIRLTEGLPPGPRRFYIESIT